MTRAERSSEVWRQTVAGTHRSGFSRIRQTAPYIVAIPGSVLLLLYAILNGVPFFYPDAFVYYHYGESAWQHIGAAVGAVPPDGSTADASLPASPEAASADRDSWTPHADRSVYYGALSALPGPFARPWNGVLVQGYLAALTVALAWRAYSGSVGPSYWAVMAVLGLFSTLGIFAGTAMPDVWAGLAILAVALLVGAPDRLAKVDRLVLWGIVLFAAMVHSSHLALIAVLGVLVALARVARVTAVPWSTPFGLAAVVVAAAGLGAFSLAAIERVAGNSPLGRPFLTAHLVDGGPGMAFIRAACPEAGFAVCERADELPVEWRRVLFRFEQAQAYKRRLVEEDLAFARATLAHDPAGVLALAARDAARQTVRVGLVSTPIRAGIPESAALERSDSRLVQRIRDGRLFHASWLYPAVAATSSGLAVAAIAVLAVMALRRDRPAAGPPWRRLLAVTATGLLLNAAICGILASPYDRFQARVIWLVPLLAALSFSLGVATSPRSSARHQERHP